MAGLAIVNGLATKQTWAQTIAVIDDICLTAYIMHVHEHMSQ